MSDEPERRPYRLGAGEGRRLWAFGDLMILKATAEETNGRVFVMEQHVPRHRQAPGRHVHAVDDQAWFVISGHGTVLHRRRDACGRAWRLHPRTPWNAPCVQRRL